MGKFKFHGRDVTVQEVLTLRGSNKRKGWNKQVLFIRTPRVKYTL